MGEFTEALIGRVRAARAGVQEAVAREHGVEVPSVEADRATTERERG